ncbi:GNAT family N-acetyltransferase [Variovorax sp. NFACC27]|uniref:GNAT family N-acetyltransferase n=1 Tax=unclassified Variovorax TaxID=663243 RepID=UPI0008963733|nr:Ribosomal protein S18 acetylase RimI [Variovorax sp. NFACC28]SEF94353.1 Ribosomal protein S18 acetylase RimI [Variovorax sp. NFACC29]SFB91408.1 Ribosomal protein S18 acetylase RimI [Variovorax sp. NFACC26]SFF82972.1 Ribosomal protein S18 acetylase RimI [Variovorax sp. NFACC27]
MTAWTIRRATKDDAASIADCAVEAFRHYIPRLGLTPTPMTRDYGASIANAQVWVAQQQEQIVAALVLDVTDEGFLIDVIAVRPTQQGTGVGRALLELAEREALRQGHDSIYLFTNEKMSENRALYERIGYVEYKRLAFAERTRVFLRKQLK